MGPSLGSGDMVAVEEVSGVEVVVVPLGMCLVGRGPGDWGWGGIYLCDCDCGCGWL